MTPLFLTKNLDFSQKYSSLIPFLVTSYILCLTSDNSISQNIGETFAWAVPHLTFWGDRPPSPSLSFRPCEKPTVTDLQLKLLCHWVLNAETNSHRNTCMH